ncbi:hypothetical protein COO60DRAFT_1206755 [Scenedesmus sp. NREL 46B-D3]|nr:hypothetical protein COO60DRAFT_1206755 [Scenedesmus sp. NREL 46B-D3]
MLQGTAVDTGGCRSDRLPPAGQRRGGAPAGGLHAVAAGVCAGAGETCSTTVLCTCLLLMDGVGVLGWYTGTSRRASRGAFNRFRIAAQPGVMQALVQLLQKGGACARGSAAAALSHLAAGGCAAVQGRIGAAPGAIAALVQMLHDTGAGLGCAAALALRTLAQGHPRNQTLIGSTPGAVSGLVAMALGRHQQGALQAMAAAALQRLADNHPVNGARIRRESSSYSEYYGPMGVGKGVARGGAGAAAEEGGAAADGWPTAKQQQQQQHVRWQGLLAEHRQQQQHQHMCVV